MPTRIPELIRSKTIRWSLAALALTLTTALAAPAEDGFPYVALVTTNDAAVRSGPADDFYETDLLGKGTRVEVWRHDGNGWCAIRPPAGSFSWIAAEHIELTPDPTLARIINTPVKTRVGSRFSNTRDVEYISLRRGEMVEVVGVGKSIGKQVDSSNNEGRWFRIAPPSGEFRWVHVSDLRRGPEPNAGGTGQIQTFDLKSVDAAHGFNDDGQPANGLQRATRSIVTKPLEGQQGVLSAPRSRVVATPASHTTPAHPPAFAPAAQKIRQVSHEQSLRPSRSTAEPITSRHQDLHINAVTWETIGSPTDLLAAPEPRSFTEQHDTLNLMLSQSVLGEVDDWKLGKVKKQTELLLASAQKPEEQALAKSLLVKIGEFQSLQSRKSGIERSNANGIDLAIYRDRVSGGAKTAASERVPGSGKPAPLPEFQTDAQMPTGPEMPKIVRRPARPKAESVPRTLSRDSLEESSVFDAVGQLIAVKSRRSDMPRYALTNRTGEISRFVTVPAKIDLSKFVNRQVGILGEVGYLLKLEKPSILAEQIVLIKK